MRRKLLAGALAAGLFCPGAIEVSAAGYAPALGKAVKAVGTGENLGE